MLIGPACCPRCTTGGHGTSHTSGYNWWAEVCHPKCHGLVHVSSPAEGPDTQKLHSELRGNDDSSSKQIADLKTNVELPLDHLDVMRGKNGGRPSMESAPPTTSCKGGGGVACQVGDKRAGQTL